MLKLQLSFQLWTSQMQETLNLKKHGDTAFRSKDFVTAIDCYTQVRILFEVLLHKLDAMHKVNVAGTDITYHLVIHIWVKWSSQRQAEFYNVPICFGLNI